MKYLIDTDWVIDHLKGVTEVTEKLSELAVEGLSISVVSLAELYEGVYYYCYSRDPEKAEKSLDEFLFSDLTILEVNEEISRTFGMERGKLRKQKKVIGDFDLLIASTAIHYNLTLLTNNRKHFKEVTGLQMISI